MASQLVNTSIDNLFEEGTVVREFASKYSLYRAVLEQVLFEAGSNELSLLIKGSDAVLSLFYREAFIQNFGVMNRALRQGGPVMLHHDFDVIRGKLQHSIIIEGDEINIGFASFRYVVR